MTDRKILQIAALCHDMGHEGIDNGSWSELQKLRMLRRLSSTSVARSYVSLTGSFGSVTTLEDTHSCSAQSWESTPIRPTAFNELLHALNCIETISPYTGHLFPGRDSDETMNMLVDLILQTDVSTYQTFFATCKFTSLDVLVLLLKLADLGHFLADDFGTHAYWVFRIHSEMGTARGMTLDHIAADTMRFGSTFVLPLLEHSKQVLQAPCWNQIVTNYRRNIDTWRIYDNRMR